MSFKVESGLALTVFLVSMFLLSSGVSAETSAEYFSGNVSAPNSTALPGVNVTVRGYTRSMLEDDNESVVLGWNESNSSGVFNVTDIPTEIDDENITGYLIDMKKWNETNDNVLEYISKSYLTMMDRHFFRELEGRDYVLSDAVTFNVESVDGTNFSYEVKDYLSEQSLVTNHHEIQEEGDSAYTDNFSFYGVADRGFLFNFAKNESPLHLNNYIGNVTEHEGWNETTRELTLNITLDIAPRRVSGYVNTSDGSSQFDNISVVYQEIDVNNLTDHTGSYNRTGYLGEEDIYSPEQGFFNISMAHPSGYNETYLLFIMAYNGSEDEHYGAMKRLDLNEAGGPKEGLNTTLEPLQGEESELIYYDNNGSAEDPTQYPSLTTKLKRFKLVNSTGDLVDNYRADVYMDYTEHFDGSTQAIWRRGSDIHTTNSDSGYFEVPTFGQDGMYVHIFSEGYAPRSVQLTDEMLSGNDTVHIELEQFNETNMVIDGDAPDIKTSLFRGDTADRPYPQPGDKIETVDNPSLRVRMEFDRLLMNVLGGDTSFRMTNTENNVTVHYSNVDASKSGAPGAVFDSEPGSAEGEGFEYLWRFGSTGPSIYDRVLVSMPYNETVSENLTIHIPFLYDEDWNVSWNASNDSPEDVGSHYDTYIEDSDYKKYLNGTGIKCQEDNENFSKGLCYEDVDENLVWFEIPHFSGVGVNTEGYAPPVSLDAVPDFNKGEVQDVEISLSAEAFDLDGAEDFGVVWNITAPGGSGFGEDDLVWGDAYVKETENSINSYNNTSTELENWIDGDTGTLYWAVSDKELKGNMSDWLNEKASMHIQEMNFTDSATPGKWNFTMELVRFNITNDNITRVGSPLGQDTRELIVRGDEVWVNASLPGEVNGTHFNTIQGGIQGVADGGTVNVFEGTYDENIVADRPLTLQTSEDVNISASSLEEPVVSVGSGNVIIDGFTLRDSFAGIMAPDVSGVEIVNNTITNITTEGIDNESDPGMGIVLLGSNASLSNNTLAANELGIILGNSEIQTPFPGNNTFENNFIDYANVTGEFFTINFGSMHPVLNNISLGIQGNDPDNATGVEVLEDWKVELPNANITLPRGTVINGKDGATFSAFSLNASEINGSILEAGNGVINSSVEFGVPDEVGLVFSEPISIELNVSDLVGEVETFDIVKSHNETGPWTQTGLVDLSCEVSDENDICEFQTTEASYFAVGDFEKHSLDISSTSGGSVNEPGEGTFEYVNGTVVDIKAEPNSGYSFEGWTGDTAGVEDTRLSSTTVKVSDNYSISAEFNEEDTGSSDGGGGGTTPPSEPEVPSQARSWGNITPGVVERMQINDSEELGVKQISISVMNQANDVKITVTKQEGKPADVDINVSGKAYRYMNIEAENLEDDNVDEAKIQFDVNKSWVEDNNIDPEKVYLNRYAEGIWNRLGTDKVSESSGQITYEADTPGFSFFAVSGDEESDGVSEECPSCPDPTEWSDCVNGTRTRTNYRCSDATNYTCESYEETEECEPASEGSRAWLWIVLIIVVVIVGLVFYFNKEKFYDEGNQYEIDKE